MTYRATLTRRRLWGLLPPFVLTTPRNSTPDRAQQDLRCMYTVVTGCALRLRSKGDTITITRDEA